MACVAFRVLLMCTPLLNSSCESRKWEKINLFFKKTTTKKAKQNQSYLNLACLSTHPKKDILMFSKLTV